MNTVKTIINKQKSHAFGKDVFLLGQDSEGILFWLGSPEWDCGWYWGFGYVETYTTNTKPHISKDINSHEHVSGFFGKQEFYDAEKRCFRLSSDYIHNLIDSPRFAVTTFDEKESWELSELFEQFYFLQKAAENFGRGKCHTANTQISSWEDKDLAKRINDTIIPQVTARILEILSPSK